MNLTLLAVLAIATLFLASRLIQSPALAPVVLRVKE